MLKKLIQHPISWMLCTLLLAGFAWGKAKGVITYAVEVCDPNSPTHCIVPDASGNVPITGSAGQASLGNVGALTRQVCLNPTVTSGTYGQNVVIGGLLTFPALFTSTGSGTIQAVTVDFTTAQTVPFQLFPFHGLPTNATTWTDHVTAAITGFADISLTDTPITLANPNSSLSASMTNYGQVGIGQAYKPGSTNGYFVLLPSTTATASLAGTTNVLNVCVTVLADS